MTEMNNTDKNYAAPPREVTFTAVTVCLRKYFDFSGRASRSEYWWFYTYYCITDLLFSQFAEGLWGKPVAEYTSMGLSILFLSPMMAVGMRRLHDINRSGGWQLFIGIPVLPFILFTKEQWNYLESGGYYELNTINVYILPLCLLYMAVAVLLWLYWFTKKGSSKKNQYN